jgi:hypothetical protein
MLDGPRDVLAAAMAGDVDAFMAGFQVRGDPPGRDEAAAFGAGLRSRYGPIRHLDQDPTAKPAVTPGATPVDPRRPRVPYRMRCEQGTYRLDAVFVVSSERRFLPMILKWGALAIRDPERGDLVYPPGAVDFAPPASEPTSE